MNDETVPELSPEAPSTDTDAHETSWRHEAGLDGDANFEKFESVADLAKSYTEATSMIGNSVRFPSEEAGEEDVSAFNQKMLDRGYYAAPDQDNAENVRGIQQLLGLPQEAKGYEFSEVDGYTADPESEGAFKAKAHELGLTAKQADGIHSWLGAGIANDSTAMLEQQTAAMAELKGEWGQAFDHKMAANKNTAAMLEERVPGISGYLDSMAENGYDANMIRLMDAVTEMMGESGATPSQPRETMTKSEAMSRVTEAQSNPDHWWHKDPDQLSDAQKDQRVALLKAAFGG